MKSKFIGYVKGAVRMDAAPDRQNALEYVRRKSAPKGAVIRERSNGIYVTFDDPRDAKSFGNFVDASGYFRSVEVSGSTVSLVYK